MRKFVFATAAAAVAAGLFVAAPAQADLSCYEAGFEDKPGVEEIQLKPPRVVFNDGEPYVRRTDCPPDL